MRLRRPREPSPPTIYIGDYNHKLSRIPALAHDDDDRPRREDLDYGKNAFTDPPVPLPRWLTGAEKRKRRG